MQLSGILERLQQPVPNSSISQRTLKRNIIAYISYYNLCDLLDERCGIDGWEWKQIDCQQIGNRLTQTWELTIIGSDRHSRKLTAKMVSGIS